MKISELLHSTTILEDTRPTYNFDADDLSHLNDMKDLSKAKQFALELISRPSQRPMKPAKLAWFKAAISQKNSVNAISKMLYDMMLSGEGHGVIGSAYSTDANSYRQKFGEGSGMRWRAYDLDPVSAMTPDKKVIRMTGKHSILDLPIGSIVLQATLHDDGDAHKASYTMVRKVLDTDDLMAEAFEDVGPLDVAAYPRSADVELAFAQQAPKHL